VLSACAGFGLQYAAAKPINIPDVRDPENNIHAAPRMMPRLPPPISTIPAYDQMNKTLFQPLPPTTRAIRIVRPQRSASAGLDPNIRFGNVELVVAKDIGQETVQYVSNIYKYYVAYKMTQEQRQTREQAMQTVKPK
jgi:membrane-bound lytic murein transglycosylase MltF